MLHLRNDLVVLTVGKIGDEETLNLYSGSRHPFYLSRLILSALAGSQTLCLTGGVEKVVLRRKIKVVKG